MATRDIDVTWRGEMLAGTLHLPDGSGRWPTVLLLQGSGPGDRDADGYFDAIRPTFLERGIAVHSFDKPGCGRSTGDWRAHPLFDRADQATTVLDALAIDPGVDGDRMGVWGHSQGGWLAQIVAARRPDLAFAIANSGPSISVVDQDRYGCEHWMRSTGRTDDEVAGALAFIDAVHEAAARGATFADVDGSLLTPARDEPWSAYLALDDEASWRHIASFVAEAYEPVATISKIRCPFLAVFGAQDVLVPAWSGAQETGDALAECPDATVVVFPRGDHRIQVGGPLEFAPGYLDLIGDWAGARVTRR